MRLRSVMRSVRLPLRREVASRGALLQRPREHEASDLIPEEKPARTGSPKVGLAITRTSERRRTRTR